MVEPQLEPQAPFTPMSYQRAVQARDDIVANLVAEGCSKTQRFDHHDVSIVAVGLATREVGFMVREFSASAMLSVMVAESAGGTHVLRTCLSYTHWQVLRCYRAAGDWLRNTYSYPDFETVVQHMRAKYMEGPHGFVHAGNLLSVKKYVDADIAIVRRPRSSSSIVVTHLGMLDTMMSLERRHA